MISFGQLKACRVLKGERFTKQSIYDADKLFTVQELIHAGAGSEFDIAIPCMINRLVVIDIDVPNEAKGRKVDGRKWWREFAALNNIDNTFTVLSKNGGFHLYFELPHDIDHMVFSPRSVLGEGVEVKYRGTVHCPPTEGYTIHPRSIPHPIVVPPALMVELLKNKAAKKRDAEELIAAGLNNRFTTNQIEWLKKHIPWVQANVALTREEWRDGIFSIKAGTDFDHSIGEELSIMWTMNQGYSAGDEALAVDMYHKADPLGDIKGGTIIHLVQKFFEEKNVPLSMAEVIEGEIGFSVLERAGVMFSIAKNGKPQFVDNETNAALILETIIPKDDLFLNTRSDSYYYKGKPVSERDVIYSVLPMLQKVGGGLGFERMKKSTVMTGLEMTMFNRAVDPHEDWIKTLKWDGEKRIENFFIQFLGGAPTEYNKRLGRNLFTALAARGLEKGSKFDGLFIIEGGEGARKSTLVNILGRGMCYVARGRNILTSDDSLRQMHQSVTVEFPELIGLRNEDPEIAKAFVTTSTDKIRGLYERKAIDRPRGFIMFGTTNQDQYLTNAMGKRRWLPFKVPEGWVINTEVIEEILPQLYAEGVELFKAGYDYWEMPAELLESAQSGKLTGEHLRQAIFDIVDSKAFPFTAKEVYDELSSTKVIDRGGYTFWAVQIEHELKLKACKKTTNGKWMPPVPANTTQVMQGDIACQNSIWL